MADKVRTMSAPVRPHYGPSTHRVMGCDWFYKQEEPSFFTYLCLVKYC